MIKLKKTLLFDDILILILILSIFSSIIRTNSYRSIYTKSSKNVEGIIKGYSIDGNKLHIVLHSREDVIGVFYFQKKHDIDNFINSFSIGDKIKLYGVFERVSSNKTEILFDYKKYLEHRKIYYRVKISKIELLSKNKNIFYLFRDMAIKRCHDNSYLLTFILGNKNSMDKEMLNIYQKLGISHLFSISGMHISLLSSILLFILGKNKYSYIIVDLFLLFYLVITGFMPSVMRSVLFFILLSLNKKLKFKVIDILMITCILSLVFNSYYIYDISFIYSYSISFTLIIMSNFINRYSNYFIKILLCSFVSILSSLPITLYNFNEINLFSLFFNLLYIPLVSIVVFPLALLSFIIPIFMPLFNATIRLMENMSVFLNTYSYPLIFKQLNIVFYIIYYLFIVLFLLGIHCNKKMLFIPLIVLTIFHYFMPIIENDNYMIMIDVGQGDSLLIHFSNKNVLIDTGGSLDYNKNWKERKNKYSVVKNTTIPLLKKMGIRKIDFLILTHGDYDHMGEAINLVENFKVEKVIFNCGDYNDLEKELIKVLDKKRIKHYSCIKELNIDKYKLIFLQTKDFNNENDNSNVIYTDINGVKMMFMGDAGVNTEKEIMRKYNLSDIDILKVGHHGSDTSSSKEFINEINPDASIISVGKNNRYGHPKKSVLDTLSNSKIYRTDLDGSIEIKINKGKYEIRTCSP